MLEVGDVINVHGKEGLVCFEKLYAGDRYICLSFGDNPIVYEVYKYKYVDDKLLVHKLEDSKELGILLGEFTKESVSEFGLLESLKPTAEVLDKYYEEHKEEINSSD